MDLSLSRAVDAVDAICAIDIGMAHPTAPNHKSIVNSGLTAIAL
jgi:hypothetical protein